MALDEFPELNKFKNITPQAFSDILRLKLLYKYGGILMDSTIFFTDNKNRFVSNFDNLEENTIYGYHDKILFYHSLENWFICIKNSKSVKIKLWLDQTIINYQTKKLKYKYYPFCNYLRQHVAYMQVFGDTNNNYYLYYNPIDLINSNPITMGKIDHINLAIISL